MNIFLACENLFISLSYFTIVFLVGKDLWKQKNYRSNILALAAGGIFFTCALGHLIHSLSYFLATRYDQITTGYSYLSYVCGTLNIPNPDLVGWIQGLQGTADGLTVMVAIIFLSLHSRYHLLSRGGSVVFDYQQQVAQYQQEDTRLRTQSAELEAQVAKRTADLEAALHEAKGRAVEQTHLLAENEQQRQFISLLIGPIEEAATKTVTAAAEILATTSEQASTAAVQVEAINHITTTVEEVKVIAAQTAQQAEQMAQGNQVMLQAAQRGTKAVESTIQGMGQIRQQVEVIAQNILILSERTQAIGAITTTVSELADQSNLLALNAAIEAARAGEQGRSFAVVSQHVRDLAERSKAATTQVQEILTRIQKATNSVVMVTEEGMKSVEKGVQLSGGAGEVIRQITTEIESGSQANTQIVAASHQQMAGMEQIGHAMRTIQQTTNKSLAGTRQTEVAVRDLHTLARNLQQTIANYRLRSENQKKR